METLIPLICMGSLCAGWHTLFALFILWRAGRVRFRSPIIRELGDPVYTNRAETFVDNRIKPKNEQRIG